MFSVGAQKQTDRQVSVLKTWNDFLAGRILTNLPVSNGHAR